MIRPLEITPVLNGFVVTAGCQKLVFTTAENMTDAIAAYYRDPEGMEKWHIDNALNKSLLANIPQPGVLGYSSVTSAGSPLNISTAAFRAAEAASR